jgi:hypothetical protein
MTGPCAMKARGTPSNLSLARLPRNGQPSEGYGRPMCNKDLPATPYSRQLGKNRQSAVSLHGFTTTRSRSKLRVDLAWLRVRLGTKCQETERTVKQRRHRTVLPVRSKTVDVGSETLRHPLESRSRLGPFSVVCCKRLTWSRGFAVSNQGIDHQWSH